MALLFIAIAIEPDVKADPSMVALHEYEPLSDCCTGLNCS